MTTVKSSSRPGGMVRNVLHLGLGQVVTTILTILLSATMARTLGSSDFGLLYLVTSIATFAYVFVDWGHGQIVVRDTARYPERSGDLLGSALAVRAATILVACIVAVATTWMLGYDVRTRVLTGVLILSWLPQYLGLTFGWIFRGSELMDRDAMLSVALKLATFATSIACFALGGRLFGLMFAWSVAGCLTLVIGIVVYRRLHLPAIRASMSTSRQLMKDGVPLIAMTLATAIGPFFSANILYKITSPAVVGWFGAASNINGTLIAPATILVMAVFPRLSRAAADAAEFKRTFGVSFRMLLQLGVLVAVGTYLFADVPVELIYSLQKFGPAADVLRAFAPVALFLYVDVYLGVAIVAAGKAGRLAGAKVISVVVTSALVFVLVPFCQARFANGGLGVVYATVIGEALMVVTGSVIIREAIDRSTISDACRSLIVGAVVLLLFRNLPAFSPFLAIPLCVLVFAGLSLLIGAMKRSDVEMLLAPFRKPLPVRSAPAAESITGDQ